MFSDLIHGITNGQVLPSKHIILGSPITSLTSSNKVVKILHRYEHICSYDLIEHFETEATYTMMDASSLCPPEIELEKVLSKDTGFDNFDRFVESL